MPRRPRLARRLGRGRLAAADPARASSRASPSAAGARNAGTELEFLVFQDTYEEAWHKGYRDLSPANLYNVDYSLLGTARVEPLIRRIRNAMAAAGMVVEDSKGECNFGQHEINFRYADALRTADEHAIYKNGAKEIAAAGGHGDHVHGQVRRARGQLVPHPLLARRRRTARCSRASAALFDSFLAGPARVPARADAAARAEHQLLQALRGRLASRRRRSRGATTTARARCASSATGRRCASRTASAAPTSTRTSR